MKLIPVSIALVAAIGGVWIYGFDSRPKCDSPAAIATVKYLALQKINGYGGLDFLRYVSVSREISGNTYLEDLVVDSFRKRGDVGPSGSICAAQIGIRIHDTNRTASEISAEYTIEPTTDGKTMVTARFRPNT